MHLYAIARKKGTGLEYYHRTVGSTVTWTDDPTKCWAITRLDWAHVVWWMMLQELHFDVFVHPLPPEHYDDGFIGTERS